MKKTLAALMMIAAAPAFAQGADQSEGAGKPLLPPAPKIKNADAQSGKGDPVKRAEYDKAMVEAAERQKVFADEPSQFSLDGKFEQGGLVFGQTVAGAKVTLDGEPVMVGADGRFVMGFGRDAASSALVVVSLPDGSVERRAYDIAKHQYDIQRIDGLDQSKVSGFTEEQLEKIAADTALKKAARKKTQDIADWSVGFDWPVTGRISGVFGSQRILNGEPKRPHSGLDIAAAKGTPIRAPAPGIVRLAETGMYFEGGLVLLDHGHWLESAFLHMSEVDVKPGQRVEKGDIIGAVGATGRATGPHLHWSMKWRGELVDPQLLLDPLVPAEKAVSGAQ